MEFIEIEVDGVKNQFPVKTGWDQVTIGEWRQIYMIDDNWSDVRKKCASISIMLTGDIGNHNWFMKMRPSEFNDISSNFKWIGETKIETKESVTDCIEIGGDKYYCLNDFNTISNYEIEALEKISCGDSVNFYRFYNLLCTIFFRKKVNDIYEDFHEDFLKSRADLFDDVLISDIMSLFFFSKDLVRM